MLSLCWGADYFLAAPAPAPGFFFKRLRPAPAPQPWSKAIGPDGLSNLHLKHVCPSGLTYLTHIFNLSTKHSQIIDTQNLEKKIHYHSPPQSYRPVSLLCPAIKILERLILLNLQQHLPVPDFQHGFRPKHSTISALNELNQDISTGFNAKKPPQIELFSSKSTCQRPLIL